jgi:hypothetical protein
VGTPLKLCLSRTSSPSFTCSVILNITDSLTAEP